MQDLWQIITNAYSGYANYLWHEITHPGWHNYFYALTGVSLVFFILEVIVPWRKNQAVLRRDFWLDLFYMYFNFFLFSLIIYNAGSDVVVHLFRSLFSWITQTDLSVFDPLSGWPIWGILVFGFFVRDFIQWWTHRLLHFHPKLWEFHKVHHSVKEMGFAAHLRYHWMETVVYRTLEYIPLAMLGIGLYDFYIIHIFSLMIGHFNHSNLTVSPKVSGSILGLIIGLIIGTGGLETNVVQEATTATVVGGSLVGVVLGYFVFSHFMRYLFNSPEMHIWHHSKELPPDRSKGVNFGLSLAIWDYFFRTAYIPHNGRDIELGFPRDEKFPKTFWSQITYGFKQEYESEQSS